MQQLHRLVEIISEKFIEIEREGFQVWKQAYLKWKELESERQKNSLINKVIEVLKTSKRGKRSLVEEEILAKYLVTIACVPKLTGSELRKLSNEVDWVDCTGRTLIFLQGDYGACFYMIAQGSIDLFLETSKDKEMVNCRKYGDLRGKSIQEEDCNELGKKITTLTEGKGFGEYAILSKTHKFRGATAVTTDERSLLLVVLEETYNTVFRKHHFRQAQMSSAMSLLKDIPAFNWYSYSKMSQIAYNLKSQSYHGRLTIVKAGQPVTNVLLVHTGLIKVVDTSHHLSLKGEAAEEEATTTALGSPRSLLTKHVTSPLYVRELGRGQLIGETEVLKGLECFEMTYEACGACEVFELSREHFEEVMHASRLAVHDVEDGSELSDYRANLRLHDLSEMTQLLRPSPHSPRGGGAGAVTAQPLPPFRTYMHHEAPRVPLNRPTQPKPHAVVSTYDELKEAALSRESEHGQKVERVRRMMMEMTTGTSPATAVQPPQLFSSSAALSSSLSLSSSFSSSTSAPTSSLSRSPRKPKKQLSPRGDSPTLLEEYEMVEDLRALLPLFSGNIADSHAALPHFKHTSGASSGLRISAHPSPSLPTLSSSTTQTYPPLTPNGYSASALKSVSTSLSGSGMVGTGRVLVMAPVSSQYSPPSNAIIEQYHRSIGRSELLESASFLHPSLSLPHSTSSPAAGARHSSDSDRPEQQHYPKISSPLPPHRPPRESFENRLTFEPKTEDELLYEDEIKKLRAGPVIASNPFEALGLPSATVYRSPPARKSVPSPPQASLKPHPPSSLSPSKCSKQGGGAATVGGGGGRRAVRMAN